MIGTARRSACSPGSITELSFFSSGKDRRPLPRTTSSAHIAPRPRSGFSDPRSLASQAVMPTRVSRPRRRPSCGCLSVLRRCRRCLREAVLPRFDPAHAPALRISFGHIAEKLAAEWLGSLYPKLTERLDLGLIWFGGARVLNVIAAMPSALRHQFKRHHRRAHAVGNPRDAGAEQWLPEQIVILADADTLAFARDDASDWQKRSTWHHSPPDCEPSRSAALLALARSVVTSLASTRRCRHRCRVPRRPVVDLSGGARGERRLVELSMHNGQRIIARQSTGIVLRNDSAMDHFHRTASRAGPKRR